MLKDKSSSAIIAVSDLDRASSFYGGTLGLMAVEGSPPGVMVYRTGDTRLVVYTSAQAGTNKANAAVWGFGEDIDQIVGDLIAAGVRFEHYPEMGMDYANGIHSAGGFKGVWLKDPDGNILHFNNM